MNETATFLLGAGVFLIVVVLILEMFRVRCLRREAAMFSDTAGQGRTSDSRSSTLCESKDCVRCSKNKEILLNALTRLSFYTTDSKVAESVVNNEPSLHKNDVMFSVSSDIRISIEILKQKDQYFKTTGHESKDKENVERSNPHVFKCSGIREQTIWCLDDFPAINLLEKNFTQIYLEFIHLYKSPLSETTSFWKRNETSEGLWEIVMLVDQGRRTKASELCPLTMGFIDKIPYFMRENLFGNISFSVVHPGTQITAHCGSTNCRIRCHLGLKVPTTTECCSLLVGKDSVHWEEGKSIFFNDAFLHSVHHRGPANSGERVVLMLDLWHPDIGEAQRKVLDYAFSS